MRLTMRSINGQNRTTGPSRGVPGRSTASRPTIRRRSKRPWCISWRRAFFPCQFVSFSSAKELISRQGFIYPPREFANSPIHQFTNLLIVQRHHRIDARGASRGEIAGDRRHEHHHSHGERHRDRVGGGKAEEQARDETA